MGHLKESDSFRFYCPRRRYESGTHSDFFSLWTLTASTPLSVPCEACLVHTPEHPRRVLAQRAAFSRGSKSGAGRNGTPINKHGAVNTSLAALSAAPHAPCQLMKTMPNSWAAVLLVGTEAQIGFSLGR